MANRTMQTDMEQARSTRVDFSPLVGTWFGIKLDENHIAKLLITEQDGALLVHPYGSPDAELSDWGQVEVTPYTASGSTVASGFHAQFRLGTVRVEFLAIKNFNVLLLQTFTSFHDGSGRTSEFGKAYYRRSAPELVATTGISTGTMSGEWVNTNPVATTWVSGFTLTENAGAITIRVRGASDPTDWGEAEITTYKDRYGERYLYAEYDLEQFEAIVGVISVKNLVVLNVFCRSKGSEPLNTFCREFFYRNRGNEPY